MLGNRKHIVSLRLKVEIMVVKRLTKVRKESVDSRTKFANQ